MKIFNSSRGIVIETGESSFITHENWNILVNRDHLHNHLSEMVKDLRRLEKDEAVDLITNHLLPPLLTQEVWAAGVTYLKSRDARIEESKESASSDCYQKVYDAVRPELFFKSMPYRVAGHNQHVRIRKDSTWNVPEPELALFINSSGIIQGYSIGNDMSSRSIEGENPLYLSQAKIYERSTAIGPCLYVPPSPISADTLIKMNIQREGKKLFEGSAPLSRMKRKPDELASFLFRELIFNDGCFLLTGTCLVPSKEFTLKEGDIINIQIDGIGTLTNTVGSAA